MTHGRVAVDGGFTSSPSSPPGEEGQPDGGSAESFAKLDFFHKVDSQVVSSTTIFMTSFHQGDGGITYSDNHRDIV